MHRMTTALHTLVLVAIGGMLLATACTSGENKEEEGFMRLFNGQDLTGWVQRGGEANYSIEDGAREVVRSAA